MQFVLTISFILAIVLLINKKLGLLPAIIYCIAFCGCGFISATYSLQCGCLFLTTLIATLILLIRIDKIKDIHFFMFVVGMIANYFDYLTVPLISLGIPLSVWIFYKSKDKGFEKAWKVVIMASIAWLAGYAGAWIFKWAQYDLTIAGSGMLDIGFRQSFYRMTRNNQTAYYKNIVSTIIVDCLPVASVFAIATCVLLPFIGNIRKQIMADNHVVKAFLLIMAMPIVWYSVLANHTLLHYYFVYRHSILFYLGGVLAFYYACFENGNLKIKADSNSLNTKGAKK
jgi:hypothetical protein